MPLHHKVTPHPPPHPLHQALLTIGKGEWLCSYPLCASETAVKHVRLLASNVKDLNPIFDCLIQIISVYSFLYFNTLEKFNRSLKISALHKLHGKHFLSNYLLQEFSKHKWQAAC